MQTGVLDIVTQMYHDEWRPDYIVGVTRGGLIPAVMMSHYTGIKMHTLDVRLRDGDNQEHNAWMAEDAHAGTNVLVLDDINDTGATFKYIIENFGKPATLGEPALLPPNVKFAALINNKPSEVIVDYHGYEIDKSKNPAWIVFPWEEWQK